MLLYMLKPNSEAVLKVIVRTGEDQRSALRIADIAKQAGVCEKTARTHIQSLQTCGYLLLKRKDSGSKYSFEVQEKAYAELGSA